ncbi:hypothetical protein UT300016_33830 [Clostridium senegalense]
MVINNYFTLSNAEHFLGLVLISLDFIDNPSISLKNNLRKISFGTPVLLVTVLHLNNNLSLILYPKFRFYSIKLKRNWI